MSDTTIDAEIPVIENLDQENSTTELPDFHPGTVDNPFLYSATDEQIEKFLLTCMFVAGKNATVQQTKLDEFVALVRQHVGEFCISNVGLLTSMHNDIPEKDFETLVTSWLKQVKAGQYSRLFSGIKQLTEKVGSGNLNLRKCKRCNLTAITGIGYKTASMFMMYTRKNWKGACLDTHILKYLKEEEKIADIPDSTPQLKAEYERIEKIFLECIARVPEFQNKTVAEVDFAIWSKYRAKVSAPAQEATVN